MHTNNCNDSLGKSHPEDEWFTTKAEKMMKKKIFEQYRKKVGNISILGSCFYTDIKNMCDESHERLLPYLRYQCRLENRLAIQARRQLSKPPQWVQERRLRKDIHPTDIAQMITNTYMNAILAEHQDRIKTVEALMAATRMQQAKVTDDLVEKYSVSRV